jgi:hypothetical protein
MIMPRGIWTSSRDGEAKACQVHGTRARVSESLIKKIGGRNEVKHDEATRRTQEWQRDCQGTVSHRAASVQTLGVRLLNVPLVVLDRHSLRLDLVEQHARERRQGIAGRPLIGGPHVRSKERLRTMQETLLHVDPYRK